MGKRDSLPAGIYGAVFIKGSKVEAEYSGTNLRGERNMHGLTIEDYIQRELSLEEQQVANEFVCFLKEKQLEFYKDTSAYWKDKIYYWVKRGEECICYIAINNPDEKDNHWTVWSADMESECLDADIADSRVQELAWKYVDRCIHCGSCGGGIRKVIFGKEFADVCGCTFRVDNPKQEDLVFLKKMVELQI